jgi:pSer/pThr/pTyr-binding forkhead associated (FHA) protein
MTGSRDETDVWHLRGVGGQYIDSTIALSEKVVWIGRAVSGTPSSSTHLLFEDQSVSRVHGALAWAPEYNSYVFHHRSQTNPTFLNDQIVNQPQLLKPGDKLHFGHQIFIFELAPAQAQEVDRMEPPSQSSVPPQARQEPETPAEITIQWNAEDSGARRTQPIAPPDSPPPIKIQLQPLDHGKPEPPPEPLVQESHPPLKLKWEPVRDNDPPGQEASSAPSDPPSLKLQWKPESPERRPSDHVRPEPTVEGTPAAPQAPPPTPELETSIAPPRESMPLQIGFRGRGQEFVISSKKSVTLSFSPHSKALKGPLEDGESVVYQIPAKYAAELVFEREEASGRVTLTPGPSPRTKTRRITTVRGLTLDLGLPDEQTFEFKSVDLMTHQHCECWLASEQNGSPPSPVEDTGPSYDKRGVLAFQTGAWQGARVTLLANGEDTLEIGPGTDIGGYAIPIQDAPKCRIRFVQDKPHVEVLEADAGQYLSINGELLFAGQSSPLMSGSGLFLGQLMLYWTQPTLQSQLAHYKISVGGNSFPVSRSIVRLGTGAHCEILLNGSGLASETGLLEFVGDAFVYRHLDSAYPAQVDGTTVSEGSEATVKAGSTLQVGLDCLVEIVRK